jgi:hypothetical protein
MVNLGSRKAIVAGALAAALLIAGCGAQSQTSPNQLGVNIGPGGVLLQQPALNLTSNAQQTVLPTGEFGGKVVTADSASRFSVNLDATESAVKAQEGVAVKAGCGMP